MATAPSLPSEVGWQFVSQYYTFVNKHPSRLHCFYTKNSAFIHGTEGEDGQPSYGQHEIHEKILSIGFQDCKVYIHSVDAQASANKGIVVQAIGEMSNNNEPWRKFAQTFFLAEQPNGYFVLNDIFRYLKEDSDEESPEEEDEAAGAIAAGVVDEEIVPEPAPGVENNYHPNPQQQSRADPPPALESQLAPPEAHVEATPPHTNGNGVHHAESPVSPEPAPAEPTPAPEEEPTAAAPAEPSPASPSPALAPAEPATPAPPTAEEPVAEEPTPPAAAPITSAPPPAAQPTAPAPAPRPAAPEKPKTWANLAAAKPTAWGSALATEVKGVSAAAAPAHVPNRPNGPPPRTAPAQSAQSDGPSPGIAAANAITTPQCFVKAVIETIDANHLRAVLTARFGPIKELEIVRSKACAFLEFEKLESAKRAITASLPQHMGGEGGVRIGEGDPAVPNFNRDAPRIVIETRKERGERPPSKPRGGAPTGGERGGFRGGSVRGRGAPRGAAPAANNSK